MHPITGKVQTYVEKSYLTTPHEIPEESFHGMYFKQDFSPYATWNQKIPHLYAKENVIKLLWEKLQRQVSLPTPQKVCMSEYMKMEKKVRIEVRRKIEPERFL